MYGLEKKAKTPFEFDLEKELRTDAQKARMLLKATEERIQEIKELLRQGTASEEFDNFGVLLHGYAALQKVLSKVSANKK